MFVKCPKCELNYMESTDKMCKVCYREIYGTDMPEEAELCNICNETPVMQGKDVCSFCFKEILATEPDEENEAPADEDEDEMLADEADVDSDDDDLVGSQLHDMDSLEALEEEEADADDERDNDEDE